MFDQLSESLSLTKLTHKINYQYIHTHTWYQKKEICLGLHFKSDTLNQNTLNSKLSNIL